MVDSVLDHQILTRGLQFGDGIWFGLRLRKKAKKIGFKGVAGLMRECYGTRWAGYAMFTSAFIFLIPYAAIQIRGISVFFDAAFPNFLPFWGWSLFIVILIVFFLKFL